MPDSRYWTVLRWVASGLIACVGCQQIIAQHSASALSEPANLNKRFSVQARRGREQYAAECAMCHAQDLTGLDPAPALTGATFMRKWREKSLGELFDKISKTMPQNNRGGLSTHAYLDIVVYLAALNGINIGTREIRDPKLLKTVIISTQNVSAPSPRQ